MWAGTELPVAGYPLPVVSADSSAPGLDGGGWNAKIQLLSGTVTGNRQLVTVFLRKFETRC